MVKIKFDNVFFYFSSKQPQKNIAITLVLNYKFETIIYYFPTTRCGLPFVLTQTMGAHFKMKSEEAI
ncbi:MULTISPECIES: hypothetical protein [Fructobacillus]|jgi:hypothetical protein|uniref:Uncharacterized protein n=1 Tax=Fructobacillus cardui TaxID=2893170 RepID=A0ABM9N1W7_9LACO|nr:hypothetical protein [Fructobacillus sp. EFB-N1]KMK53304.1 hypothetical protein FEFB_09780 [Fructobacillus sp. EFB-N1]CAK1241198.1 unnamed protein product [Fructobacillus cardui]CAK1241381.1 unnamed protein product [Fructobacillus cardui]CAK1254329.1 unnamed protein product [Fructobacillus cardui]